MKAKRWLSWLIAVGMTAAMFACAFLFLDVMYAQNDDSAIVRSFMGSLTGEPASFHVFIHGLLALPLCWISNAFPGIAWFTWLQLALVFLGCVVVAKSCMQSFALAGRSFAAGVWVAAALLLAFGVRLCARMTFTETAALLGAAAVGQVMSLDLSARPGRLVGGVLGAGALVALGYALRQVTALPVLGFCALAFGYRWLSMGVKGPHVKPLAVSLAVLAAAGGALAGWRYVEVQNSGEADYLAWQEASTQMVDYYGVLDVSDTALEAAGLTLREWELASARFFLDDRMTTEAFATLRETMEAEGAPPTNSGLDLIPSTFASSPADARACALGAWLLVLALLGAALGRRWLAGGAAMLCALAVACALAVLALQGRLPMRAVYLAVLPAIVLLACLLPRSLPQTRGATALLAAALLLVGAQSAYALGTFLPGVILDEDQEAQMGSPMDGLEEYAAMYPDTLFLYDETIAAADLRLFPDAEWGLPTNVSFWGGWPMRTRETQEQFARFGMDVDCFTPDLFLRDDVVIASGRLEPPPEELLAYLRERLGTDVEVRLYSEYGPVYFFRFSKPSYETAGKRVD